MTTSTIEELLTEKDLARILRKSVASVRKDRQQRKGVQFIRVGSLVRYRPADLRTYLDACTDQDAPPRRKQAKAETAQRVSG